MAQITKPEEKIILSPSAEAAVLEALRFYDETRAIGSDAAASHYSTVRPFIDMREYFADFLKRSKELGRTSQMLGLFYYLLKNKQPEVAVDLCSGPGYSSAVVLNFLRPERLILIDSAPEALEVAKGHLAEVGGKTRIEYLEARVEDLQSLQLPPADLVFMKSGMRYVRLQDQPSVFNSVHAVLKPGGEFLFDLPLTLGGDWLPEEDDCIYPIAQAFGRVFNLPSLDKVRKEPIPSSAIERLVISGLNHAGFSVVSPVHFKREFGFAEAVSTADFYLADLFSWVRQLHPDSYRELKEFEPQLSSEIRAGLEARFDEGMVYAGMTAFHAVK